MVKNRDLGTVCIYKLKYVSDIFNRFNLVNVSTVLIFIVTGVKLTVED